MTPQIADYLTDQDGNIVKDYEPEVIRKVFSEETAERVMKLMEGVVQDGTGSAGYVEGYSVAGKTSTSTIENGEYAGYHVLSFGCYAPSDDPEIVVLVVVNMPESKDVASSCASRAAARIVSGTLEYLGVERKYVDDDYTKLTTQYTVPSVVGMTYGEAMSTLYTNAGAFDAVKGNDTISDDTVITSMYPAADSLLYKTGQVVLYSSAVTDTGQMPQVVVPDFSGKTISECITEASNCGVNIYISGNYAGVAVSQSVSGSSDDSATATPTPTPTPSPEDYSEQGTSADDSGGTVSQKVPAGTVIEIVME
jgi:stage V sporulation protein D (sporulation-specific penicillin-binding protein)